MSLLAAARRSALHMRAAPLVARRGIITLGKDVVRGLFGNLETWMAC